MFKKILFVLVILFLGTAATAQSIDTSYHLLWYKGKKIKANVLLTTSADTVAYNPDKGIVKVTSKKGNSNRFDKMQQELNKTPQRMDEMAKKVATGLPTVAMPVFGYNIRQAFNEVKSDYDSILKNSLTLPDIKLTAPLSISQIPAKGPNINLPDNEGPFEVLDELIKEFHEFIAKHRNDNINTVPVPPIFNFSYCYSCDREKLDAYEKDMQRFIQELRGEEDNAMLQKALAVARFGEIFTADEKNVVVQKEAKQMIEFIFDRMNKKILLLIEKYIDDAERCGAVMKVALSVDRQVQLTGIGKELPQDFMQRGWTAVTNYIKKAIDEKNYPIALNLHLILSVERQFQLMGETMPGNMFAKAIHFNQFKMNMNVSAKTGGNGGYLLAQVKGDNWFCALPDTTCHLRWILVGPSINKAKVDLLAAEMKGNGIEIPYVGTKIWNSAVPTMKVDFCKVEDKPDSIIASPFYPEDYKEMWVLPKPMGATNLAQVNNVLVNCFMDIERVKQEAAKFEHSDNVEKLKKDMLQQYEQMMKNGSLNMNAPKGLQISELTRLAIAQQNSNKINEMRNMTSPGKYIFQPVVHNKETLIIKERLNGKEIFPQNTATEYAFFHLTLEHDPDGPYNIIH